MNEEFHRIIDHDLQHRAEAAESPATRLEAQLAQVTMERDAAEQDGHNTGELPGMNIALRLQWFVGIVLCLMAGLPGPSSPFDIPRAIFGAVLILCATLEAVAETSRRQ